MQKHHLLKGDKGSVNLAPALHVVGTPGSRAMGSYAKRGDNSGLLGIIARQSRRHGPPKRDKINVVETKPRSPAHLLRQTLSVLTLLYFFVCGHPLLLLYCSPYFLYFLRESGAHDISLVPVASLASSCSTRLNRRDGHPTDGQPRRSSPDLVPREPLSLTLDWGSPFAYRNSFTLLRVLFRRVKAKESKAAQLSAWMHLTLVIHR